MTSIVGAQNNKYRLSRRGKKLQISDDARTLVALPKEVPERTWAEILQKEENDLVVFDIREEILEEALKIGYEHYMEKQCALFTVHCAAQAWLKLIDWHFYRHDPGEEPSAYPPCFIPKRSESWLPDRRPEPSPRDTWCQQRLHVVEDASEEPLQRWPSHTSLEMPVIDEIPVECRFPGKVNLPKASKSRDGIYDDSLSYARRRPLVVNTGVSGVWNYVQDAPRVRSEDLAAESELLQRVTDYSTEELTAKESSTFSALKTTTPVEGSLQGAGDSTIVVKTKKKLYDTKCKSFSSKASVLGGRSRAALPPLDSQSKISVISDCRLRNLRLDTQYEISSEKVDTPPGEIVKRK